MIARTEREARRNAAILVRRIALIERWAIPKIKKAYKQMGDQFALLYTQGGEGRMKVLDDEAAQFMEDALNVVYDRVASDLRRLSKGTTKGAIQSFEKKDATDEELERAYQLLLQEFATQAASQAGFIVETLGTEIAVMLAVEEGLVASGPDAVAKAIRARSNQMSVFNSIRIARTEVLASASQSQEKYVEELWDPIEDGQMYKRWHSIGDSRTRNSHRKMNGKIVPKDQTFLVGSDHMRYPGDRRASKANVINCRCTISYLPEELVHSSQR